MALQRTMNEIYRNGSSANIPPLKVYPGQREWHSRPTLASGPPSLAGLAHHPQFTAPSMASVLEQLNVINGILFIPLR